MRHDESGESEDELLCVIGGEREETVSDGAHEVQWGVDSRGKVQRTEQKM